MGKREDENQSINEYFKYFTVTIVTIGSHVFLKVSKGAEERVLPATQPSPASIRADLQ